MKTSLKSSALPLQLGSSLHLPNPPKEFGLGFQRFLSSAPAYEDDSIAEASPMLQPLRFLQSVSPMDQNSPTTKAELTSVQQSLSESLGAAILLAARPTTKSLVLAKAVHALRHG